MSELLNKKIIEAHQGVAGESISIKHGATRLHLFVDRRSQNDEIRKSFYFVRKFRGRKLRMKIGDVSTWSVAEAEKVVKEYDVMCDKGLDPRDVKANDVQVSVEIRRLQKAGSAKLGDIWEAYLDARALDVKPLKPLSVRDYRKHIAKSFDDWAVLQVGKINEDKVKERYSFLVIKSGAAQANQAMRCLSAVLNWMIGNKEYAGALTHNPVRVLKKKTHKVKPRLNSLEKGQIYAWWCASQKVENLVARTYLRFLLLSGPRRDEALTLRWTDVDLNWDSCRFYDTKNGDDRRIPLTAYVKEMLLALPRVNEWVFFSEKSKSGHMVEPAKPIARIESLTGLRIASHDLRRSFSNLAEWPEVPDSMIKQIIGHKPNGVTEQHYKDRPIDLLRIHLQRYENFILQEVRQGEASSAKVIQLAHAA